MGETIGRIYKKNVGILTFNSRKILQVGREYMGKKPYLLQIEVDIDLGREIS